jgi:hypothetical protein
MIPRMLLRLRENKDVNNIFFDLVMIAIIFVVFFFLLLVVPLPL